LVLLRTRIVLILAAASVIVTAIAAQVNNSPWPPGVQEVSDSSPPLPPDQAMQTFFMPPGYRLELVASEPLVQDPIVIDFDADGRIWIVEMTTFQPEGDLAAANERDPECRIVVLEDTDDDGSVDTRTVFMDGLVLPRAIKVLDRGVLIGEPPNLWYARDTNGDFVADDKELVTGTYGRPDGNIEHNANSLLWAMDNWIYTSEHDGYLRLKNGEFEIARTLARGQWGASQDDVGRLYRNTNSAALFVDIVAARYFMRNPTQPRTRGLYESLEDDEVNTVFPVRPTPGVNRGYQTGILRQDDTLRQYTAVGSPTIYRGDRLPAELYGNAFLAEPAGNLVGRLIVSDDGTTLRARRAYDRAEFLASTDERFRPVWLATAPDGTLYVVDMYRGVIQHRDFITEYLRDWILEKNLQNGVGFGRIYRVVHDTTRRDSRPALGRATTAQLVAALSHPNGWRRDMAQQLLVQRTDMSAVPALKQLAERAPLPRTKLHALWTLDGIDAIDEADVLRALDDSSRDVRTAALRLSERWLSNPDSPVVAAALRRLDDTDWNVRRQLAATLGEMRQADTYAAIAALLERHGDDPVTVDAAVSSVAGSEMMVLDRLLLAPAASPQRTSAIAMLSASILRGGQEPAIQRLFDLMAEDRRSAWQRDALMLGAEVAVLGVPAPDTPAGRGGEAAGPLAGAQPCPTCPGARGGPGGASVFNPNRGANRANQAPQGEAITLAREPALARLAQSNGDELGQRAARVLARVAWAGKPGAPAAATAPLSAIDQQRFTAGHALYLARCQGCHQDNGRGLPSLGPALAGSAAVLGSEATVTRIMLHGKEGAVGLMPPAGATMTDEQIASVLTYIRRAWDNTASPVDAAAVSRVRGQTAGRNRPWTEAELSAVAADQP
jgi:mono/diheme cytochrome c family protein/glucose/arabinose dehydrogenase